MFNESCNDRRHRISDHAATNHLRDSDNAAGISDNSAEIGDDDTGIINKTANMIPSQTPS